MQLEEVTLDDNWVMADRPEKGDEKLLVRFYLRPVQNRLKSEGGEFECAGAGDPRVKALLKDADRTGVKVEVIQDTVNRRKMAVVTGAGRPIFDDVEYVEIRAPDTIDKFTGNDRPATNRDRKRFKRQYLAFKEANSESVTGTPLEKWPMVTGAQVMELKYLRIDGEKHSIRTVEELAEFPEAFLASLGALGALKKKAQDYLEAAKGQAPMVRMRAELDTRDAEMGELRKMLEEQSKLIQSLTTKHVPMGPVELVPAHAPIPEAAEEKRRPGRPPKKSIQVQE